jgi:hypothetical protein
MTNDHSLVENEFLSAGHRPSFTLPSVLLIPYVLLGMLQYLCYERRRSCAEPDCASTSGEDH